MGKRGGVSAPSRNATRRADTTPFALKFPASWLAAKVFVPIVCVVTLTSGFPALIANRSVRRWLRPEPGACYQDDFLEPDMNLPLPKLSIKFLKVPPPELLIPFLNVPPPDWSVFEEPKPKPENE